MLSRRLYAYRSRFSRVDATFKSNTQSGDPRNPATPTQPMARPEVGAAMNHDVCRGSCLDGETVYAPDTLLSTSG